MSLPMRSRIPCRSIWVHVIILSPIPITEYFITFLELPVSGRELEYT